MIQDREVPQRKWWRRALGAVNAFEAISAIFGGFMVVTGWPYQFPLGWLASTPFTDYTIPGLILGVVVGGSAVVAAWTSIRNVRVAALASVIAGGVTMGWIVGEMILLREIGVTPLQPFYFLVGATMSLLGARLALLRLGPTRVTTSARRVRVLPPGDWLAAFAGFAAALASLVGFIPGVYRDSAPLIIQSHGQDLVTLVLGVPALWLGLWASAGGSMRGRLIALGALGYLLYTYLVYAFDAVLNPATVLYIAVVGFASWSFFIAVPGLSEQEVNSSLGDHLPRRTTGIFLLLIAATFALLWLSQIGSAAIMGVRPQALVDAGWPTSPIYVLDLAFVLPLCTLTGISLFVGRPVLRLAIPLLVFTALLSVGVLSITSFAAADGQPLEFVQVAIFIVTATVATALALVGLYSAAWCFSRLTTRSACCVTRMRSGTSSINAALRETTHRVVRQSGRWGSLDMPG